MELVGVGGSDDRFPRVKCLLSSIIFPLRNMSDDTK